MPLVKHPTKWRKICRSLVFRGAGISTSLVASCPASCPNRSVRAMIIRRRSSICVFMARVAVPLGSADLKASPYSLNRCSNSRVRSRA